MFRKVFPLLSFLLFLLLSPVAANARTLTALRDSIGSVVADKDLKLGFALYDFQTGQEISINGDQWFPMQSVYKFPIAVALLSCVDNGECSLADTADITPEDLYPDHWSPIREQYPRGTKMPLAEVVRYMVSQSDNCATDIILKKIGGTDRVQQIIEGLGARGIYVKNTERELQSDWNLQFENRTTPENMIAFLKLFNEDRLLSESSRMFLWDVMSTRNGRLDKSLPENVLLIHKTGYSGVGPDGTIAALNDVGIMVFPDNKRVAVATFITGSRLSNERNLEVLGRIGYLIASFYNTK